MKKSILTLGTSLSRTEQNTIYGGSGLGTCDCDISVHGHDCWKYAPFYCKESFECDPTVECEELP